MKKAVSVILAVVLTAAMSVSVFADNFTPSIEQKTAPEVIEVTENGKSYYAVIIDRETEETEEGVPMYNRNADSTPLEFYVVSAAEKTQAALPEITQNLTNAEEQIKKAADIGKLDAGLDKDIEQAIDEFYGDTQHKIGVENLVVSDLFDASLVQGKSKLGQAAADQKVRFMIRPSFTKNDFFVLLHNIDGTNWEVVNDVEWTEEGYLIVTVDRLSVFAIAVERMEDLPVDPQGPSSPQTNNMNGYQFLYAGIAVLCVGAAVFFFVKAKKRGNAQ